MDLHSSRVTPASLVSQTSASSSSSSAYSAASADEATDSSPSEATTNIKSAQRVPDRRQTQDGEATVSLPLKIDITAPSDDTVDGCRGGGGQQKNISCAISTLSTSDYDLCLPSSLSSVETTTGMWIRSESINSVPSWASTISLDSHTDETVIEFIRRFLTTLFEDPQKISLELKAEFGQVVRVRWPI